MAKYYYVPIYFGEEGENIKAPGTLKDGVVGEAELVGGICAIVCDSDLKRFVLKCPDEFDAYSDWEAKTEADIDIDYPAALGGA